MARVWKHEGDSYNVGLTTWREARHLAELNVEATPRYMPAQAKISPHRLVELKVLDEQEGAVERPAGGQ
jgi:hypothetical protein